MSEYATVARPYARAAFSYATEHQCLDNWLNFLSLLSLVKKSSDILSSANCFSNEYKLNFVKTVLQAYYDEKQINFIRLLMENSRLEAVDDIFELYSSMYEDYHNIAEAEVISAHKLTSENLEKIRKKLESRYSKKIKINNQVDPSIIGGLIIKVDNRVIDASISGKLEKLSHSLVS